MSVTAIVTVSVLSGLFVLFIIMMLLEKPDKNRAGRQGDAAAGRSLPEGGNNAAGGAVAAGVAAGIAAAGLLQAGNNNAAANAEQQRLFDEQVNIAQEAGRIAIDTAAERSRIALQNHEFNTSFQQNNMFNQF